MSEHEAKARRGVGANAATRLYGGGPLPPPVPFAEAFARVFPVLRHIHASFTRPGLLTAAVRDGQHLESHLYLDLASGSAHALVGRHQRCDLYLAQDGAVSLRHALLRATSLDDRDVRVRLLDLCSGVGFHTEDDVPCESLVAEGPLFVRVGRYQLLLLPTGPLAPTPWGETAEETWEAFPERVVLDRHIPEKLPRVHDAAVPPAPGRGSRITTLLPAVRPLRAARPEPGRGVVVGMLLLRSATGQVTHLVTDEDLERGVLVGRYERCQLGGADVSLSRVHLLLLRDDDGAVAIDTASTNGTTIGGHGVRAVRLDEGRALGLGNHLTLEWSRVRHAEA